MIMATDPFKYDTEDDSREASQEVISVRGSPDGSASVCGQTTRKRRAVDWFLVSTEKDVSEEVALKNFEEIMITDFKIAGGMPEFRFPPPIRKKIGPYCRKSVC